MDKYFSSRATVRDFRNEDVPLSMIEEILKAAMRAPTCGNMQLYSVIVTREPEARRALAETHFNQPAATGAPVILTICADFNRFSRWCRLSDAKPGYDNFLSFLTATTDAVILAQQITTIAEMEGLGTCWLGTVTYNAARISELLSLPDLVVPVAALSIGWPASTPERCERLPLEACMHLERYRDDSDSKVMELFKAKDEFEPNARFVAENGKTSLAQVFTDVRYPEAMNVEVSKALLDLLRDKKFM